MARYQVITLVDITVTNLSRREQNIVKISQQANFNSLLQAIGLRANCTWFKNPVKYDGRLPYPLEGKAIYWMWEFDVEQEDIFLINNDPVGLLIEDLQNVPIIADLENSTDIYPAVFQTAGKFQNIWVKKL